MTLSPIYHNLLNSSPEILILLFSNLPNIGNYRKILLNPEIICKSFKYLCIKILNLLNF